jgi:hypothetical protein
MASRNFNVPARVQPTTTAQHEQHQQHRQKMIDTLKNTLSEHNSTSDSEQLLLAAQVGCC